MQYAQENKFDYIGASFAFDPQTASFWQHGGFDLVHVSFAMGKSSGNHSIAVLKPLGRPVQAVVEKLQQRMQRQLAIWMTQFLQTMEADQVCALLRYAGYQADTSDLELEEVIAFAQGQKGFELCFASLQKFVMQQAAQSCSSLEDLLIEKAVQNRKWENLQRESGSVGRGQLQSRLRGLVDALIKA
jgi:tRNA(Met) cytidine acetyltransferase